MIPPAEGPSRPQTTGPCQGDLAGPAPLDPGTDAELILEPVRS